MTDPNPVTSQTFPNLLKSWRSKRRYSQLDLALEAGLSQRHISFLETGRSKPSRFAVVQIGEAMGIPASEIDIMLLSAGFAARTSNTKWAEETRNAVKTALEHTLNSHDPYPAMSFDRIWNLNNANCSAQIFFQMIGYDGEINMLKSILKPGKIRENLLNWDEKIRCLMRLFEIEVARRPHDHEAFELLNELKAIPGVSEALSQPPTEEPSPVVAMQFQMGETVLSLFSLIATVGTSADATIDDIRVETLLPADEKTKEWFAENITPKIPQTLPT